MPWYHTLDTPFVAQRLRNTSNCLLLAQDEKESCRIVIRFSVMLPPPNPSLPTHSKWPNASPSSLSITFSLELSQKIGTDVM